MFVLVGVAFEAEAVGIAISTRKAVYTGMDTHPVSPLPHHYHRWRRQLPLAQANAKATNEGTARPQTKARAVASV